MSNREKLIQAFAKALEIDSNEIQDLQYQGKAPWDSVGHLVLIREIEDSFDIMMDTEDIIALSSFVKAEEILASNYSISF